MGFLHNFARMNSLSLGFVILFVSPSLAVRELRLPPIPLSLFHPPPEFEPPQFLEGLSLKSDDNSVDTSRFPPFLQKILGGVAEATAQLPFIKDWIVKFEPEQDATGKKRDCDCYYVIIIIIVYR